MESEEQTQPKEPEQPIKKTVKPKVLISELDKTLIDLHELFFNQDIMFSLLFKVEEGTNKKPIRTFQLIDCNLLASGKLKPEVKKPEYLG